MEIIEILKNDPALLKAFIYFHFILAIAVFGFDYMLTKIANEKGETDGNNKHNKSDLE